ncbi:Beta-ketoacyl synthase [Trichophyton interdigitale]|uniref:Beta-ketoacyl synthase n=1 Tax=Trichophyton interdigitale TaxID=101480 RepID=A0A9P5CZU0_9EURO|nr:Beta-ketoacyl synthase [Trichophyton interdigitale]KAF3900835.1 Beta-ketoacyl synthase [Trichophyton interdigitale]KAG8211839.1 Beta-ketoacyl synthase [Trichophyton interdigitale]
MSSVITNTLCSSSDVCTDSPVTAYSTEDQYKDVAVIGMACRVPGGIQDPESLWQALLEQMVACGDIPVHRWEPYHKRDPRNKKILGQTTSRGYFVDNIEDFDYQFFGVSPMEVEQMDPQQRISLEVAWEALEHAGIPSKSLSGSDTAVYWGVNSNDYSRLVLEDLPNIDAWMGIGTAYCGVPNRISYHLNLTGASVAVDAACASSLVAVHHGAAAIATGESRIAIVGGVNALCGPGLTRVLNKAGAVSPDGQCCSFDEDANGYGRAEGAGAVILKNLSQARLDGDHILAVIKGTAVGHNGRTNGIMAPDSKAQQLVARNALQAANVDPDTVHYVEAHATSTALGDPTEINALTEVYGEKHSIDKPCYIGSIKPNIGHLEAGAGVMGLIKAILIVQKGLIPPQANLKTPNTKIKWNESGLKVVQELTDWPDDTGPRRAAVCSYGYGGTVSHAVIEKFQEFSPILHNETSDSFNGHLLLLSAPHEQRLAPLAQSLKTWIEQQDKTKFDLAMFCKTLAGRRSHYEFRTSAVIHDIEGAIAALDCICKGANNQWITRSRVLPSDLAKDVVWVFSGHGAQWTDMGKGLINNRIFHDAIQPLDKIVEGEINLSPIEWLQCGDFDSSDRVQILTYIVQIGISALLKSRGIYPQAVIGHLVGEIAASVVAGALSPEEGTLIVTRRAILYRQVMGKGSMSLISKPYQEVREELKKASEVAVAIDSSPTSCVIAGAKDSVAALTRNYQDHGVKTYTVKTDIAFHSPMLDPLREPLAAILQGALNPARPHVRLYSTSLLNPRGTNPRDSTYWVNNMTNPVRLTSAVLAAIDDGYRRFLEISSHPLVSHSINETLMEAGIEDYSIIHTLRRDQPAEKSILHAIGQIHCSGVEISWNSQMKGLWMQDVPLSPWVHRPIAQKQPVHSTMGMVADVHDVDTHTLLGRRTAIAGTDLVVHSTTLDSSTKPFPGSHPVFGTEIVPAACLLNTFLKAAGKSSLQNIILKVPVATSGSRTVQIVIQGDEVKLMSQLIQNESVEESSWVTHTESRCAARTEAIAEVIDLSEIKTRIGTRLDDDFTIDYLAKVGVAAMGFPWKVTEHYGNADEMIARVDVSPNSVNPDWDQSSWAPLLDAATSIGSTIFFSDPRLRMPAQIQQVDIWTSQDPPKIGWIYVKRDTNIDYSGHVYILSEDSQLLAKFTSMRFSEIEGTPGASGSMSSLVHRVAWPPAYPAEDPIPIQRVIMVAMSNTIRDTYARTLPAKLQLDQLTTIEALREALTAIENKKGAAIVYIPEDVQSLEEVPSAAEKFTWQLLEIIKYVVQNSLPTKVFVLTTNMMEAETPTALAHSPLLGLSRVIASEHPDNFGGLIDGEQHTVPLTTMKYIQGADVIRIMDGIPRTARLRALSRDCRTQEISKALPRPEGTYLVAGGLGVLGLAVAEFLASHGARRLVLISRRGLRPRRIWDRASKELQQIISKIRDLEKQGVCVHILALDLSTSQAAGRLLEKLDQLNLPPVLGVVHAAGVLENELIQDATQDAFARVLSPKVAGSLALHEAFPPDSLDFFVLFSSCGQLFGFPGQGAYGSANTFLDALATHRRNLGENAVSFQWTAWRGMGMGSDSDFVAAELESKGITDVTRHDAFQAWLYLIQFNTDHGVVLRSRSFEDGEPLPTPLLNDIAIRRARSITDSPSAADGNSSSGTCKKLPSSGPELKAYLEKPIRECVASVLHLPSTDVDSRIALSDLGLDSVMNTAFRQLLQRTFKVNVPPTLVWSYPTVKHLVGWFSEKLAK